MDVKLEHNIWFFSILNIFYIIFTYYKYFFQSVHLFII